MDLELAFEAVTNLAETGLLNPPSAPSIQTGILGQYSFLGHNAFISDLLPHFVDHLIRHFVETENSVSDFY
ncbi:MAG: hypothetical protein HC902_03750 [Calothrix sp. SM1_5_4]|nr:hypothetical protein [Calothrix sp. SM1_5_4]